MEPREVDVEGAERESYILRVLISIDQLGNTIAGGHPDVTISARTGYFANVEKTGLRVWWRCMEKIIDFSFRPIDGPRHSTGHTKKIKKRASIGKEVILPGRFLALLLFLPAFPSQLLQEFGCW